MQEILLVLEHPDGRHRVLIFRRFDGLFGYEEEVFSEHPYELCWLRRSCSPIVICDSPERALKEARGCVPWLKETA
jgi:hypothetical protein